MPSYQRPPLTSTTTPGRAGGRPAEEQRRAGPCTVTAPPASRTRTGSSTRGHQAGVDRRPARPPAGRSGRRPRRAARRRPAAPSASRWAATASSPWAARKPSGGVHGRPGARATSVGELGCGVDQQAERRGRRDGRPRASAGQRPPRAAEQPRHRPLGQAERVVVASSRRSAAASAGGVVEPGPHAVERRRPATGAGRRRRGQHVGQPAAAPGARRVVRSPAMVGTAGSPGGDPPGCRSADGAGQPASGQPGRPRPRPSAVDGGPSTQGHSSSAMRRKLAVARRSPRMAMRPRLIRWMMTKLGGQVGRLHDVAVRAARVEEPGHRLGRPLGRDRDDLVVHARTRRSGRSSRGPGRRRQACPGASRPTPSTIAAEPGHVALDRPWPGSCRRTRRARRR